MGLTISLRRRRRPRDTQYEVEAEAEDTPETIESQLTALIAVLSQIEANQAAALVLQREAVAEMKIANTLRKDLVQQEKVLCGSALRNEFRLCRVWTRMPMLNGDPLPEDLPFPSSDYKLKKEWPSDERLTRLADAYGIAGDRNHAHKEKLAAFLKGGPE